jgi:hypothetical protein
MKFVSNFEVNDIFEHMDYLATFSNEMGKYEMAGLGNLSLENFMPHINKLMETLMGITMNMFNVSTTENASEITTIEESEENENAIDTQDALKKLIEAYMKKDSNDEEVDWRKMTDEEWEKLLARIDADIDDMVERVKEESQEAKEEQVKEELEKEAVEI